MRHPILQNIASLMYATEADLEDAVDGLIMESEMGGYEYAEERALRAEALAILGHELRRRQKGSARND